jgi:hypothetical protein
MRRVAIIICAALLLSLPSVSHAQYNDNDEQNRGEYHDEDSQPLALLSYFFYPIGYAVEWLVARPLHYIANDTPLEPVFRPVGGNDTTPPPPVPIIPDNTLSSSPSTTQREWTPSRPAAKSAPENQGESPTTQPYAPPSGGPSSSQPALH